MTTTPVQSLSIPPLCGLSGCWAIAQGHAQDQHGHTLKYCGHDHKAAILAQRSAVYGLALCQVTTREVRHTLSDYIDDMLGTGESSPDED